MSTLIDVLDENGNKTGDKKTKAEIHEKGLWHSAAHVWIYNSRGEILLQLRAKDKDSFPGLWDISAAGHVDSGETPEVAALREIEEEIGLKVSLENLKFIDKRIVSVPIPEAGWQNNEIDYIYLYKFDGDIHGLEFPDKEVEALDWIKPEDLEQELKNSETSIRYVPHGDYYNFVISSVRKEISL